MPDVLPLIITALFVAAAIASAYYARQQVRRAVIAQVRAEAASADAARQAKRAGALAIPIGTRVRRRSTGLVGTVTRHVGGMVEAWTPGDAKFPYARPWTADVEDLVVLSAQQERPRISVLPRATDSVAAAAAALLGTSTPPRRTDDTAVINVVRKDLGKEARRG